MKRLFRTVQEQQRAILALTPQALELAFETYEPEEVCIENGIAIVNICGPLEHHHSYLFDSYDCILERLEEAFASEEVQSVVMCIDSPGGDAAGSVEAHRRIQRLKKKYSKRLYAYSNESMYSAAYSLGSAADEIWVPETGGVGSVGAICAVLDKTKQNEKLGLNIKLLTTGKRKADTHADRELTPDVVASLQKRVNYLGDVFFRCVAKARNMTPKAVQKLEAGVFFGKEAVSVGLADGVAGWYKFLEYVQTGQAVGNFAKSAKGTSSMKTRAQLKKAQAAAARKVLAAKSNEERIKCFSEYEAATKALVEFGAATKLKYVKKTEERHTEEENDDEDDDDDDDDDSDEDSEEEESEESEEESEEEESEEDSEEEESEEEESDEDTKRMSKKSKAKSKLASASAFSLKTVDRLYKAAAKATGKTDISEIFGALEGMSDRLVHSSKLETRLAKIEGNNRKQRVKSMLEKAQKDGRVTPFQAKGLFEQGLKDPKWLKGYLSSQPKQNRDVAFPDADALPDTFENQNLSKDQEKMMQQAAASMGLSPEQYKEQLKKFAPKPKTNGVRTQV